MSQVLFTFDTVDLIQEHRHIHGLHGISLQVLSFHNPSNYDLVVQGFIAPRTSNLYSITSGSLDDFPTSYYLCSGAVRDLPEYTGYAIVKTLVIDVNSALQEAFMLVSNKSYTRTRWGGTWGSWSLNTNASS